MIQTIEVQHWKDYELLDVGNYKKLERFGKYILIRPEPQAIWKARWKEEKWKQLAHVEFLQKGSNSGNWQKYKDIPDRWFIEFPLNTTKTIQLKLSLTGFKHVGLFPEQSVNWRDIFNFLKNIPNANMLNLFAYTGAASVAGAVAGAKVTHVDSVKQIVTWANENAQLNQISTIRWIVEDALNFVKKQSRKAVQYQCIVLDPPAYGHGPKGERWQLEELIDEMIQHVLSLLDPQKHLLILNAYSLGLSALVARNLLMDYAAKNTSKLEFGELYIPSNTGYALPLGIFGKLRKE
ncbi:MAG: SAM-dependent methyltransferase [Bacteroidia bacterium]|nr:MAG: SAM-dependent methyltransferase [Bacteroidia bacterium]